ncbi:MAG: DUF1573 domain-containing protein [Phycisphaerales bacterium]|nr:DUF1573 domain-containing protein [Phycisphaerales bacterium]
MNSSRPHWMFAAARGARLLALAAAVTATPVLLPSSATAQVPPGQPQPGLAPVQVEPPLKDFGLVGPSVKLPTTFILRNVGSEPLRLGAAVPSCKCTTIEGLVGNVIPPGGTLELPATMEAPSTPGVKEAKIMLAFAGFNKPVLAHLKCEVGLPIVVEEEFVDALKGVTSGQLTVKSRDGKPFRILTSNGEPPEFVGFDPAKDEPRNSYVVKWSVAGWPHENMRLWWILETDRPGCEILPARIRHEWTGSRADPGRGDRKWIFKEQMVSADAMTPGKPKSLTIDIENSEPKAGPNKPASLDQGFRHVTSVRSLDPNAVAKLVKVTPKGTDETEVEIEFVVKPGFTGMLYAPVMVTTTTGEHPIAVVASVRS